jgi:hypothetical protein
MSEFDFGLPDNAFDGFYGEASLVPPPTVQAQPGSIPEAGPAFIRFVSSRFAAAELLMTRLVEHLAPTDQTYVPSWSGELDGSGNLALNAAAFFTVEPGFEFSLHRLAVNVDGYTWGSPYTNTAGFVTVTRDGQVVDGANLTNGLPLIFTWGTRDAPKFRAGETIQLQVGTGPANKRIEFVPQGTMSRAVEGWHR